MKYVEGGAYMAYGPTELRVVGVARVRSTQKNTPGIEFTLTNEEQKEDGTLKTIKHTFWLTASATSITCGFLRACGLSKAQIEAWNEDDVRQDAKFVGLRVIGTLEADEATNGKTYTKVKDFSWEALGASSAPRLPVTTPAPAQPPQSGGDDGQCPDPTVAPDATADDLPF